MHTDSQSVLRKVLPLHAMKVCRSRGTAPLILNLGTGWRWVVISRPCHLTYSMEQRPSWEANWFSASSTCPNL